MTQAVQSPGFAEGLSSQSSPVLNQLLTSIDYSRPPNAYAWWEFTEENVRKIVHFLRQGLPRTTSCQRAGVSKWTFFSWMRQAEPAPDERNHDVNKWLFKKACELAEAEAESEMVGIWQQQMPDDWRAVQKFLAARFPEHWGETSKVEVSGPNGGPIEFVIDLDSASRQINASVEEEAPIDSEATLLPSPNGSAFQEE